MTNSLIKTEIQIKAIKDFFEKALEEQLTKSNCEDRMKLQFHKGILQKELSYTIGGGIGQSRICMFFLNKQHIGEVQCSIWDEENKDFCKKK